MRIVFYIALLKLALAATVTYNWAITWVEANPDGHLTRPVIGINNKFPLPTIEANLGDTVIVNVVNQLGNETTGIHFHGQTQRGTNTMDGPSGVTQCSIPPGGKFTYNFTAGPAGTYWYHSHNKGQYPDGFRAPLIVHDPNDPYLSSYSEEFTIKISDWFWSQMPELLLSYLSPANSAGIEPAPNTTILNDSPGPLKLSVTPGKTYRVRIINVSNMASNQIWIQDHNFTVIAVDGVNVQAATNVQSLYIATAQRVDILFTAKKTTNQNYFFISMLDEGMYGDPTTIDVPNAFGYLVYNPALPLPETYVPEYVPFLDDTTLVPYDLQPILAPVTNTIHLSVLFVNDDNDINRATITTERQTYVPPIVPTLYTALSAPAADVMDPLIYGNGTNPFVVSYGDIVEVVLDNLDSGSHPIHMHGHQFQVVFRGGPGELYDGTQALTPIPVRRDVIFVYTGASVVWRYVADNPGVFLLHCHIEFHVEAGLTATIIESPNLLQETLTIPADHLAVCHQDGQATIGNAAGNSKNYMDMDGQPLVPARYDCGSLVGPCPPT